MKQCENGHFFDDARYDTCPYCVDSQVGKTVAINAEPLCKTVAVNQADGDEGKTVGILKKSIGIDPPVGYLVCIHGPERGKDFRLRAGRNFIGRDKNSEIPLCGDASVSRECHAIVSFDNKHTDFKVAPGTGRGITYLNEKQVESACGLNAYDIIEVGETKLVFLPLCGEKFRWDGEQ